MEEERFEEITKGKTIEDVIEKLKQTTAFSLIQTDLEKNLKVDSTIVNAFMSIECLFNKELSALVFSVSHDILASLIATKLTAEYELEKEKQNGSKN